MDPLPALAFLLFLGLAGLFGVRVLGRKLRSDLPADTGKSFLLPGILLSLVLLAGRLLPAGPGEPAPAPQGESLFPLLVQNTIMFGLLAALVVFLGYREGGMQRLGLAGPRWKSLGIGTLAYLLFLPCYVLAAGVYQVLLEWMVEWGWLTHSPPAQKAMDALLELPTGNFITLVAIIVLIQPFFEELIFRSFLQPGLSHHGGRKLGLVVTAGIFALMHEAVALLPIFSLGLLLGFLYQKSGRVWIPFLVHALHNGIMISLWIGIPDIRERLGG